MIVSLPYRKNLPCTISYGFMRMQLMPHFPDSKRIVRNVFAQCKDIPCLLCYDEKKTWNDIDIKRGDMMDFPSRFFLFLLSTGVFFALALMIPLTSGMLLILPPLLALASTALVSHIFSQKKTHGRVGERSGRAERKNGKLETNRNF